MGVYIGEFGGKNIEQDLNRLLSAQSSSATLRKSERSCDTMVLPILNAYVAEFDLKQAMGATAALISYMHLINDEANYSQYTLRHHDLSQYMKLDASALRALNLMPSLQDQGGNKNTSLFGLLNRCKTSQGVRLLGQWLKQPLVNLHMIGMCPPHSVLAYSRS